MLAYMEQAGSVWNGKARSELWGQGKATVKGGNYEKERKAKWRLEIIGREAHAQTLCWGSGHERLGRALRNPQHADCSDWKYESSAPRMTHGRSPPPWVANENTDEEEGRAEDSTTSQGISQPLTMSTLVSWILSHSAVGGWGGDSSDHLGKERGAILPHVACQGGRRFGNRRKHLRDRKRATGTCS